MSDATKTKSTKNKNYTKIITSKNYTKTKSKNLYATNYHKKLKFLQKKNHKKLK